MENSMFRLSRLALVVGAPLALVMLLASIPPAMARNWYNTPGLFNALY
jgi:hypothetical protein